MINWSLKLKINRFSSRRKKIVSPKNSIRFSDYKIVFDRVLRVYGRQQIQIYFYISFWSWWRQLCFNYHLIRKIYAAPFFSLLSFLLLSVVGGVSEIFITLKFFASKQINHFAINLVKPYLQCLCLKISLVHTFWTVCKFSSRY